MPVIGSACAPTVPRAPPDALERARRRLAKTVADAIREFDAQALEAEALWGQGIAEKATAMRKCVFDLWISVEAVLDDKLSEGDTFRSNPEWGIKMRANVSASPSAKDNKLSNEISAASAGIESKIRGHLNRQR